MEIFGIAITPIKFVNQLYVENMDKETANAIKYIADLIVVDGEKTRKLLSSKE